MTKEVAQAVEEIKATFSGHAVTCQEDGSGGVFVAVEEVAPGAQYEQHATWIGFQITFQYPYADVYPHFVRSDLTRKDQRVLGDAISGGHNFLGRPALQISRKSNRLNPATDTAALKLIKVLEWLRTRP